MMLVGALNVVIFYKAQSTPKRARHKDALTPRPHYVCCWLALKLSLPATSMSSSTVAAYPNDQQTYSVETLWTGRFIKANEPEGKWGRIKVACKGLISLTKSQSLMFDLKMECPSLTGCHANKATDRATKIWDALACVSVN